MAALVITLCSTSSSEHRSIQFCALCAVATARIVAGVMRPRNDAPSKAPAKRGPSPARPRPRPRAISISCSANALGLRESVPAELVLTSGELVSPNSRKESSSSSSRAVKITEAFCSPLLPLYKTCKASGVTPSAPLMSSRRRSTRSAAPAALALSAQAAALSRSSTTAA